MRTQFLRKIVTSSLLVLLVSLVIGVSVVTAEETFMADQHSKLGCEACHTTGEYGDVASETCLKCHGSWDELGEKTSSMQINPHEAPHFGMDNCIMCHHGHQPFENACISCHETE